MLEVEKELPSVFREYEVSETWLLVEGRLYLLRLKPEMSDDHLSFVGSFSALNDSNCSGCF
jgi:hypothetical protein